ncbi:unnamed protein product [Nippostrongylus brasiliensis]|uniref:Neur_chan_LBD domain-containing protein n=1 Tax=Nippostrongylus brasiliensis TaxID=27835 RepID=A0A0N4Y1B1_NIPBR|nr:unnamed protein product [Nippostrongylus brasiliensis]
MPSLLLWPYVVLGVLARHDSPIVIERPMNRVNVSLTVNSIRIADDVLRTSITLQQRWTDPRLLFKGVSEVPLPNNVHPWQPDTVVVNALHSEIITTSSFLNYDGAIRKRQLLSIDVPCVVSSEESECPIELTSFSNRGVELITYNVETINSDRISRISNTTVTYLSPPEDNHRHHSTIITLIVEKSQHPGDLLDQISGVAHFPGHV